jgi:hypothetical protein
VLIQYPDTFGNIEDYSSIVKQAHDSGAIVIAASDLLALTTLTPPGEWGVDVVVGSAQVSSRLFCDLTCFSDLEFHLGSVALMLVFLQRRMSTNAKYLEG